MSDLSFDPAVIGVAALGITSELLQELLSYGVIKPEQIGEIYRRVHTTIATGSNPQKAEILRLLEIVAPPIAGLSAGARQR